MDRQRINDLWFRQQPIPGTTYLLNDPVRIVSGAHAGSSGAVIALLELEPEPLYLVELGTGGDVRVPESVLSAAV